MKTFMQKESEVVRQWYVVDATGMVLGRLASQIASILRGKNKPNFTPNVDTGDFVIVINCDKIILTGNKLNNKFHYRHSGYVGGLKSVQYKKLMAETPDRALQYAVKGMLPKNSLGREMFKKLKVFVGDQHTHQAQKPVVLELNSK